MTPMEMARQAINYLPETDYEPILHTKKQIERFDALIRGDERKKLLAETPYLGEQLQEYIDRAIAAEREACAKVCEDYIEWIHEMRDNDESLPQYQPELAGRQAGAGRCAAAIRARGEK